MSTYYNEIDVFAAAWLRELMKDGQIPDGQIDTRSILDVLPSDLAGFTHCHFFAGIGGWALSPLNEQVRLANWPTPMAGTPSTEDYNAAGSTDFERKIDTLLGTRETPNGPKLVPWTTPSASDAASAGSRNTPTSKAHPGQSLTDQARGDSGTGRSGSPAATAKPGQLNAAFSLWLMGYPTAWARCAARVTRSSRRLGPKSSAPTSTS